MKFNRIQTTALTGAALFASCAWSQDAPFITQDVRSSGPESGMMLTMITEGSTLEAKSVAGAPYSADQTTTTTQTLADGNRIVHTSAAKVYRDQQGRTRVEHMIGNIGSLATAETHAFIMINDPIAGVRYNLQSETHTAQKVPAFPAGGGVSTTAEKTKVEKRIAEKNAIAVTIAAGGAIGGFAGGVSAYHVASPANLKRNTEELGDQTIEGVQVHGTRTTITIPAGAEGNEQPMQIVDERWYSKDLQTNIKTVHSDPRMGETVFTVSNVSRSNPDASLFQIPADYQITDVPQIHERMFPAPPPANE